MLTKKQCDLLEYIHEHMQKSDVPPSFDEMKDALNLKSKSGIHRLISGLHERGYIERLPHRARALEIKKLPEGMKSNVTAGPQSTARDFHSGPANDIVVPLYGKIAAGTPIEALRSEQENISVPQTLIGAGDHYALTIEGDSMINAGIHDGDTVIIKRCDTAENGTIVVALVDDHEATLKRFRRSGNKIILEPENDSYEPRVIDPERLKIQGRLVSLLRRYH